jgi:hypothetical protein
MKHTSLTRALLCLTLVGLPLVGCGGTSGGGSDSGTPPSDSGSGTDVGPTDAGAPLTHYTTATDTPLWVDACAMGTDLMPSNTDENKIMVDLGDFQFSFFGQPVTMLSVSTNGWLSFSQYLTDSAPRHDQGRLTLPTDGAPNAAVYALWEDLTVADTHGLCSAMTTMGGHRVRVVQWDAAFTQSGGNLGHLVFEVQLTEGTNDVHILWQTIDATGAATRLDGSTIGLENEGMVGLGHPGTEAVPVMATPTSGSSIRFVPSP